MMKPLRLLVAAAALNVTIGTGVAAAQTVLVRHAKPGETIELDLNSTKVATTTADGSGDATLPLDLRRNNAGKTEIDANIFIDTCDTLHRVIVGERGQSLAAQQPGCERREISGLYWVRRVNTLVVDVGGPNPTMMLIKGKYGLEPELTWGAPAGLVVFGGGGLTELRDAALMFCGTASSCGKNTGVAYTAGATLWLKRYVGVEGSYMKPRKTTASGSGDTYNFDSELDVDVITVAGTVGIPIGPVRLSGKGGTNYHFGTSTTKETINNLSQTIEVKTQGWGWLFGAGAEVWVAPAVALYAEAGFAGLKGGAVGGGEARLDDRLRFLLFGARVHIGR
jgi:hypothetical protein